MFRFSSSPLRSCLAAAFALILAAASSAVSAAPSNHRRTGATETALDRYVAAPDSAYAWKLAATSGTEPGVTVHSIDLVSQRWLTPAEVDRPEWRHWLTVVVPARVDHPTALLYIGSGSHPAAEPPRPGRPLVEIAKATRSVVAELRLVPNQPLVFRGDGVPRKEDDLIAYTWDRFLRTGDDRWPARLPMTKAVVRALDTVTAFLASAAGGNLKVDTFAVAGASKRGWTAWTAAAVDRRIVAVVPLVIDVLNVDPSMLHHRRAYGFFAPAVGDYTRHGIMDWIGTPELKALYAIEDPYSYRDRLTLPKFMIGATGDQFFLPDSSQFYFPQLPGPKYLRYIPNVDHSLRNADAFESLLAWHHLVLQRAPFPEFSWQRDPAGTLVVRAKTKPALVTFWQAVNPAARDFRLETLGPVWQSRPLAPAADGSYSVTVAPPAAGWSAHFVELAFDVGAPTRLKFTTDVSVLPDTLPFPAPTPTAPQGFLTRPKP